MVDVTIRGSIPVKAAAARCERAAEIRPQGRARSNNDEHAQTYVECVRTPSSLALAKAGGQPHENGEYRRASSKFRKNAMFATCSPDSGGRRRLQGRGLVGNQPLGAGLLEDG